MTLDANVQDITSMSISISNHASYESIGLISMIGLPKPPRGTNLTCMARKSFLYLHRSTAPIPIPPHSTILLTLQNHTVDNQAQEKITRRVRREASGRLHPRRLARPHAHYALEFASVDVVHWSRAVAISQDVHLEFPLVLLIASKQVLVRYFSNV